MDKEAKRCTINATVQEGYRFKGYEHESEGLKVRCVCYNFPSKNPLVMICS